MLSATAVSVRGRRKAAGFSPEELAALAGVGLVALLAVESMRSPLPGCPVWPAVEVALWAAEREPGRVRVEGWRLT